MCSSSHWSGNSTGTVIRAAAFEQGRAADEAEHRGIDPRVDTATNGMPMALPIDMPQKPTGPPM